MAQQSLVTSLISRGVTCDADNLVDYQSDSTSTHTNCLIQLLKSGWLRSFVSTEARILQQRLLLSSGYFQKFSKFRLEIFNNFNHLRFRSLVSGRRILQRYSLLSTPLFQLLSRFDDLKQLTVENCVTLCLPRSFPFRLRRKWGEL